MGKSVLVVLLGFLVIFYTVEYSITKTGLEAEITLYDSYGRVMAKDIAESGANAVLSILTYNAHWRGEKTNISFGGGTFTAGAVTETILGFYGIRVYSYSNFNGIADSVFVLLTFASLSPVEMPAGVTSNTDVELSGTITIDGRNHDENGNVIPSSGTLAISTTANLNQLGNAKAGGTYDGTDYIPKKNYDPSIIETGVIWPDGFPDTPDKVMGGEDAGYPEGTLKSVAQRGLYGSQYVTNPDNLTFPLRGVTYVEMGWGQTWQDIDFGNSSGILVVHNSWTNSIIKNLNYGTFKGLIIADDIDKIHTEILGAVVVLTEFPPSGNVIGNGSGSIKYSTALLAQATTGLAGVRSSLIINAWIY